MGVDHRCAAVLVAKKLLDGADFVAGLKQMRREGMPEGVTTGMLDDASSRTASLTARWRIVSCA